MLYVNSSRKYVDSTSRVFDKQTTSQGIRLCLRVTQTPTPSHRDENPDADDKRPEGGGPGALQRDGSERTGRLTGRPEPGESGTAFCPDLSADIAIE